MIDDDDLSWKTVPSSGITKVQDGQSKRSRPTGRGPPSSPTSRRSTPARPLQSQYHLGRHHLLRVTCAGPHLAPLLAGGGAPGPGQAEGGRYCALLQGGVAPLQPGHPAGAAPLPPRRRLDVPHPHTGRPTGHRPQQLQ